MPQDRLWRSASRASRIIGRGSRASAPARPPRSQSRNGSAHSGQGATAAEVSAKLAEHAEPDAAHEGGADDRH